MSDRPCFIKIGLGLDPTGQDPTLAAQAAIANAPDDSYVLSAGCFYEDGAEASQPVSKAQVFCPNPAMVDTLRLRQCLRDPAALDVLDGGACSIPIPGARCKGGLSLAVAVLTIYPKAHSPAVPGTSPRAAKGAGLRKPHTS